MRLAARTAAFTPSATLAITARARRMRAEGVDVLDFGAGEPDFDTPEHIKAAAVQALREGFTKYTAAAGIDDLKDAVCLKLKRDNGVEYRRENVIVSCGAKHTLYNVCMVLFQEGDEVLLPAPYWVSYPEQIRMAGAVPIPVETGEADGFRSRVQALEAACTPRTAGLIRNSPCNPTGAVLDRKDLEAIAAFAVARRLTVISDETYEALTYDGHEAVSIAALGEEVRHRTVVVNSLSKAYAMTGWRIGYAAGPVEVVQAMGIFQSQVTSNPTSIAQRAAVAALTGPQDCVRAMRAAFAERREAVVAAVNGLPRISCVRPGGAFYAFPNVSGCLGRRAGGRPLGTSADLADYLLEEARVAVVPGMEFGSDRHVRISYATSKATILEGVRRIGEALRRLR
ncbi:MAG: pyridoxal phosphate-dependent aminotransferase [candidate division NC10 bacterium]|nr:pyridoxal phosphate-dependent aminotransferase [candidate division NC10 bacterium]